MTEENYIKCSCGSEEFRVKEEYRIVKIREVNNCLCVEDFDELFEPQIIYICNDCGNEDL